MQEIRLAHPYLQQTPFSKLNPSHDWCWKSTGKISTDPSWSEAWGGCLRWTRHVISLKWRAKLWDLVSFVRFGFGLIYLDLWHSLDTWVWISIWVGCICLRMYVYLPMELICIAKVLRTSIVATPSHKPILHTLYITIVKLEIINPTRPANWCAYAGIYVIDQMILRMAI